MDPLDANAGQELLSSLLGNDNSLDALKELILRQSEGNPLFTEEVVLNLFEQGTLTSDGAVHLKRAVTEIKIPRTVQDIIAARIDRLRPHQKDLLQVLSGLGTNFSSRLLAQVLTEIGSEKTDQINSTLTALQGQEFIYQEPAFTERRYSFKHALTRDVVYASILRSRRKTLHERAAASIERLYADTIEDHVIQLVISIR